MPAKIRHIPRSCFFDDSLGYTEKRMDKPKRFTLDDANFVLWHQPGAIKRAHSTEHEFVLQKSDVFLQFYQSLVAFAPKKIVEIGIFEGGSIVYLDKLFQPEKLVGVDLKTLPIGPLEAYRKTKPHIAIHYGTSQDDPALPALLKADLGGEADLIIDDASHMYGLTRDTFLNVSICSGPAGCI